MDEHMDEKAGSCEGERASAYEDEVLTAREAARLLKVSADLVYEAANRGDLPHRRLGRRMLFSRGALLGWLRTADMEARTRPRLVRSGERRKLAGVEAVDRDLEARIAVG